MRFSRLVLLANALRYSCGRLQVFFARRTEMIGMWAARRPRCASSSVPCAGADRYRLSLSIRPEPGNFSHGNLAAWRTAPIWQAVSIRENHYEIVETVVYLLLTDPGLHSDGSRRRQMRIHRAQRGAQD